MNHNAIYVQLVEHAKKRNLTRKDCYIEYHHVIPRAEGGPDCKSNLVAFTAREHYIAHLLLAKIYNDIAMYHAIVMMRNGNKRQRRQHKFNSHLYERLRLLRNKKMKGVPASNKGVHGKFHWYNNGVEEVYASVCLKGFNEGRLPMSQQQRQQLRLANIGKHASDETKTKMSKIHKGQVPWNAGMKGKMPKEFIETMSMVCSGSGNPMYGKRGKDCPHYGKHWFTDGTKNVFDFECPEGFRPGKIHRKHKYDIDTQTVESQKQAEV